MSAATFRPAEAADAAAAVPLIYSSGPDAFNYVFAVPGVCRAEDFLLRAFVDGAGEFGYRNHVVGVKDGVVVATGAAWTGAAALSFLLAAARQIVGSYGIHAPGVIARGLRTEAVIRPPGKRELCIAHLGVDPALRSGGIGAALIAHLLDSARAGGHAKAILDVSLRNPRGQQLYERLGFAVTAERSSKLANARGFVAAHRRMENIS